MTPASTATPPPDAPSGEPAAALHPDHRRTVRRVILATLLVVALATGLAVSLAYRQVDGNLQAGDAIAHADGVRKQRLGNGEPLNILVMGSDSRDGAGNDIDGLSGGGERSDLTILVHVSADREEAYGVSLPRDALVTRPDCRGADGEVVPGGELELFNAAYQLGGPTCTVTQVESLTGIYIDHYVSIDFAGFKDMVDAVDGVTVCIPEDVDDEEHDIFLEAGTQVLDGEQSLAYVRERTELSANSDIGRMKRQQAFIASMVGKVLSAGTLTQPQKVVSFLNAFTSSIRPDPGLDSLGELSGLARQFRRTGAADIEFITVPFQAYEPDPNRLVWAPEADRVWQRILEDRPLGGRLDEGALAADDPVSSTPPAGADPSPSAAPGSPDPTPEEDRAAEEAAANGLCA